MAGVLEVAPVTPAMARERATGNERLQPIAHRIVQHFEASTFGDERIGSIKLAVRCNDKWLYVDERGIAEFNGRAGHFDVPRYEQLLRETGLPETYFSTLVTLNIENGANAEASIIDSSGKVVAVVSAKGRQNVLT